MIKKFLYLVFINSSLNSGNIQLINRTRCVEGSTKVTGICTQNKHFWINISLLVLRLIFLSMCAFFFLIIFTSVFLVLFIQTEFCINSLFRPSSYFSGFTNTNKKVQNLSSKREIVRYRYDERVHLDSF